MPYLERQKGSLVHAIISTVFLYFWVIFLKNKPPEFLTNKDSNTIKNN